METRAKRANMLTDVIDRGPDELLALMMRFRARGGKAVFAPTLEEVAAGERFCVHLREGMHLIPVCHQGFNRSQVLRLVFLAACARLGEDPNEFVSAPHGATSGCDPYQAYRQLDEASFIGYLHDHGEMFRVQYDVMCDRDPQQGPLHRAFLAAFGCTKAPRVGEDAAYRLKHLNDPSDLGVMEQERGALRKFMSGTFFQPQLPPLIFHRARVFVCFMRSAPIVMERLLEVLEETGADSLNATVIALPVNDDLNTALRYANEQQTDRLSKEEILKNAHLVFFKQLASLFHVILPRSLE